MKDYAYDALGRIVGAADNTGNYNLSNVSYDRNGNITALERRGHTILDGNGQVTAFGVMDDLTYSYDSGNKLMKVTDAATMDGFGFRDDASNTDADGVDDYLYDANGNMTRDDNKGITDIEYNYLNLPTNITVNGNGNVGNIVYIYDATGTKLRKIVTDTGESSLTTTDYAGNYIYENGKLQFFDTPEGYVMPKDADNYSAGFEYVYSYIDHLGNIRLSYTDADGNGLINDAGIFNDGFEAADGWNTDGTITGYDSGFKKSGTYSGKIVKATSGEQFVHSDTWVSIDNSVTTEYTYSGWIYSDGPTADIFLFMKTETESGYYTYISSVRSTATGQWEYLEKTFAVPTNIKKLNIRIDNNGGGTVWFDDIKIEVTGSELVEEKNYYPFGLKHKGYNANINGVENNYMTFNGKELDKSLGLDWLDLGARMYDPTIARFNTIDPMVDFVNHQSPYVMANNNPVANVDEYGLGIFNVIGNLFKRLGRGIDRLANGKQCSCDAIESIADAFERPDFPSRGRRSGKPSKPNSNNPTPPQRRAGTDTEGITATGNLNIGMPDLNIPLPTQAIPTINTGGENRPIVAGSPITVPTRINFSGRDGTVLDFDDNVNNRTLNIIVKTLQDYPQLKMFMYVNHLTDIRAKGSFDEKRHKGLVSKRAAAIIKFFESKGIDPERIDWDYDPKRFETKRRQDNTIRDDQKFELRNNN